MKYQRFEQLPVWQAAINLAERMFTLTRRRGFAAMGDLRDQLRRAALSVSNNIAEGFERGTTAELLSFLYIARGSAGEVRSMLLFCRRLPNNPPLAEDLLRNDTPTLDVPRNHAPTHDPSRSNTPAQDALPDNAPAKGALPDNSPANGALPDNSPAARGNLKSQISNLRPPNTDALSQISDLKSPRADLTSQISDLKSPRADLTSQISDLKSEIADLVKLAESCSRQLRAWAGHLQDSDIPGQRRLNTKTRQAYDADKRARTFWDKLQAVRNGTASAEDMFNSADEGDAAP